MSSVLKCPDCGKLIAAVFPLHDCKPTSNFMRENKKEHRQMKEEQTPEEKECLAMLRKLEKEFQRIHNRYRQQQTRKAERGAKRGRNRSGPEV